MSSSLPLPLYLLNNDMGTEVLRLRPPAMLCMLCYIISRGSWLRCLHLHHSVAVSRVINDALHGSRDMLEGGG